MGRKRFGGGMKKFLLFIVCLFVMASSAFAYLQSDSLKIKDDEGEVATLDGSFAANRAITVPDEDGTMCTTGSVCTGYAASSPDYLVGTADAGLSAEIVVGTSPGGELGGTWASPTLDDSVTVNFWALGSSTATTQAADNNSTLIATTAYVQTEINALGGTNLTCASGSCDVDDSFLLNTGDTGTGTYDFGGASFEIPNSTSLPGTCTVGQIYMDTDATTGQRIYACESSNTWALQGDGGGAGGAPTDATYITQTANGTLSNEQALSSLSTGIMRVATTTGVVTSLTDSSGISSNISDETGTGALVFGTAPTLLTADVKNGATSAGYLSIYEDSDDGTNYTRIQAQAQAGNVTYTLPAADAAVSGYVLSSNASGTLSWVSQSAGSGTKTYAVFTPLDNNPPASHYATFDTRNSIGVLDFDTTTEESAVFNGILPESASLGSGLIVRIHWMATSATTGDARWGVQFERGTTDADSDSFDTACEATSTTNVTSGIETVTAITCTNIDSSTAGDSYRLKVYRDVGDDADTMTGDAEIRVVEVRSAA